MAYLRKYQPKKRTREWELEEQPPSQKLMTEEHAATEVFLTEEKPKKWTVLELRKKITEYNKSVQITNYGKCTKKELKKLLRNKGVEI